MPAEAHSTARIALVALAIAACHRVPAEPTPAGAAPPSTASAPRYRPSLDEAARRLALAVSDGGVPVAPATLATRLDALTLPPSVDVVAARVADRWVVAALERDRVTTGIAGAMRVVAVLSASSPALTAVEMARLVGAFQYYPYRVYDGSAWSRTAESAFEPAPGMRPALTPRPHGSGRSLSFSYWIPDGSPGAGAHIALFHVTDSGLLIDEAPNPERR